MSASPITLHSKSTQCNVVSYYAKDCNREKIVTQIYMPYQHTIVGMFLHVLSQQIYAKVIIITLHSSGGVELLVKDGNIKCTNTLESRLELLGSQVRRGRGSGSDLK